MQPYGAANRNCCDSALSWQKKNRNQLTPPRKLVVQLLKAVGRRAVPVGNYHQGSWQYTSLEVLSGRFAVHQPEAVANKAGG
jgi:hypothetical protein